MRHLELPENIQAIVGTKEYSLDNVGMSDSEVRIYDKFVLASIYMRWNWMRTPWKSGICESTMKPMTPWTSAKM